jgi:hypothetical protein
LKGTPYSEERLGTGSHEMMVDGGWRARLYQRRDLEYDEYVEEINTSDETMTYPFGKGLGEKIDRPAAKKSQHEIDG